MAKRRRTYPRRYRRRFRRYRSVATNYFNVRAESFGNIQFPDGQVAGAATFDIGGETHAPGHSLMSIIKTYSGWRSMNSIFGFFKVRGFKIELVPKARAFSNAAHAYDGTVSITYFPGISMHSTADSSVIIANNSFILNPDKAQSRYYRMCGDAGKWYPCIAQDAVDTVHVGEYSAAFFPQGCIKLYASEVATKSIAPSWSIKISFYISFRHAKL